MHSSLLLHELSVIILNRCSKKRKTHPWILERPYLGPPLSDLHNQLYFGELCHRKAASSHTDLDIILTARFFYGPLRPFWDAWLAWHECPCASWIRTQRYRIRFHFHPVATRCTWGRFCQRRNYRGIEWAARPVNQWLWIWSLRDLFLYRVNSCSDPWWCTLRGDQL